MSVTPLKIRHFIRFTKESIIEKTYISENLPLPVRQAGLSLFALRARLRPGRRPYRPAAKEG